MDDTRRRRDIAYGGQCKRSPGAEPHKRRTFPAWPAAFALAVAILPGQAMAHGYAGKRFFGDPGSG